MKDDHYKKSIVFLIVLVFVVTLNTIFEAHTTLADYKKKVEVPLVEYNTTSSEISLIYSASTSDKAKDENTALEGKLASFEEALVKVGEGNDNINTGETTEALTKAKSNDSIAAKPKLILHIGPPKTGTSTIQCALYQIEKQLNMDNYYYIGSFIPHMGCGGRPHQLKEQGIVSFHYHTFFSCINNHSNNTNQHQCKDQNGGKDFKGFMDVLEYHRSRGHNIIYSSEHLSAFNEDLGPGDDKWNLFKELFQGFDVKVVFTYRDFFSWLLSQFNEGQKSKYFARGVVEWPGHKYRTETVGSIPSLAKTIDKLMEGTHHDPGTVTENRPNGPDFMIFRRNWAKHFNIDYFFLEQENNFDIETNFICQMVPDATSSCSYLQSKNSEATKEKGNNKKNSSVEIDGDRLVTASAERGWLDTKLLKRNGPIRQAFDEVLKKTRETNDGKAFPFECPTRLDSLLDRTYSLINDIVQTPKEKEKLEIKTKAKFESYVEKKKFCNLDIDAFMSLHESEMKEIIEKVTSEEKMKVSSAAT